MDTDALITQLYDEAVTCHLEADDAEQLLRWSESRISECESEEEGMRMLDSVRLLNRYVKEGGVFEQLFAALRANSSRSEVLAPNVARPEDHDPEIDMIYPPEQ